MIIFKMNVKKSLLYFFFVAHTYSYRNVQICIPTTKSIRDIEKIVRTMNYFISKNKYKPVFC